MNPQKFTIAVLDEEAKERAEFINYFEEGFTVLEISEVSTVDSLIDYLREEKVDAVAIDYKLKDHGSSFEYNGDFFFKEITNHLLEFPAFILTNDPTHAKRQSPDIIPFYIIDKSRIILGNNSLKDDIASYIINYKDKIRFYVDRIEELIDVRKFRELTTKEEEDFIEKNIYIDKVSDNKDFLSRSLYANTIDQKLNTLIAKSEALLKKISPDA